MRRCCRPLAGRHDKRARKAAAPPAAGAALAAPPATTMQPALLVAAPPAPRPCALASMHAPYAQMGSLTASAGAAAGVFERESVLLSENQPHEHAGKFPLAQHLFACLPQWCAHTNVTLGIKTRSPSPVALHDVEHSSERAPLGHTSAYCKPAPALVQELTRHVANLAMLAAATANSLRSKHFYLGFQAEHRLTATVAQLPVQSNSVVAVLCGA